MENDIQFDLIVIGGGPAGLMCAGRAAERGCRVVLLEKNPVLGKKLAITGGGRCNITNAIPDVRELVSRYGVGGKALFPAFSRFGTTDAISFFETHGLPTKLEAEGRVFPVSEDARDVVRVMGEYVRRGNVRVVLNAAVEKVFAYDDHVRVISAAGEYRAASVAIATGGMAYPETGSTGDGFGWLAQLGHKIIPPDASLVPIAVKEPWVADLSGQAFAEARVTVWSGENKILTKTGKMLFTHFGLSGPLILNMSKTIGEQLKVGETVVVIDLLSSKTPEVLDKELLALFGVNMNKKIKNILGGLLPSKIVAVVLAAAAIDPEKYVNLISREERLALGSQMKNIRLTVSHLLGEEDAIVSSGGTDPAEVDMRTMRSKIKNNVFIIGDALNFNRPSGGFSLQICWTTGYLAGENVSVVE